MHVFLLLFVVSLKDFRGFIIEFFSQECLKNFEPFESFVSSTYFAKHEFVLFVWR
jgi:hypothetical protein